jgi:hypothetical protein
MYFLFVFSFKEATYDISFSLILLKICTNTLVQILFETSYLDIDNKGNKITLFYFSLSQLLSVKNKRNETITLHKINKLNIIRCFFSMKYEAIYRLIASNLFI